MSARVFEIPRTLVAALKTMGPVHPKGRVGYSWRPFRKRSEPPDAPGAAISESPSLDSPEATIFGKVAGCAAALP